jgi:hypothetical protein
MRDPEDVGIDGKRSVTKRHRQNHARRLSPDAGQLLQ